jgi:plastocyanin
VYDRVVPQLSTPKGKWTAFSGTAVGIGDQYFKPAMMTARVGQKITWRFAGYEPHSVTVANGPRGFSSNYLGNTSGSYSFTPTVPGTYRLTCLIHPTTMAQTLKVND